MSTTCLYVQLASDTHSVSAKFTKLFKAERMLKANAFTTIHNYLSSLTLNIEVNKMY